jgi:hypothetical protein
MNQPVEDSRPLANKLAIVTGASRGTIRPLKAAPQKLATG